MVNAQNVDIARLVRPGYKHQEVRTIFSFLQQRGTFASAELKNGLYPAAPLHESRTYSGYSHVWVRDNIYIAYSQYVSGKVSAAARNANTLMAYFKKCHRRFDDIIGSRVDVQNPMCRPHVRFDGNTLSEIDQKWAHAQNDALGYFLWFYCTLAIEGVTKLDDDDFQMLGRFIHYFQAIRFWQDEDSGHWEETRKISASSIGVVSAGLRQLKRFNELDIPAYREYFGKHVDVKLMNELLIKGLSTLEAILPWECIQVEPQKNRRYEAALLFLVYPLDVVPQRFADQILKDVIEHLEGEFGIRRYPRDSYWAPDYDERLPPGERTADFSDDIGRRDRLLPREGLEAQWCIFDPIMSCIFGKRYQRTRERRDLELQTQYLNRALGEITKGDERRGIPPFRCPELYYVRHGEYVPNDHVPLLWTQANLMVALKAMEETLLTHH
jgi:phosphorylase kinase alpha/beta subunit